MVFVKYFPSPVVVIDASGRLVFANRAAADLYGFDMDQMAGEPISRFLVQPKWTELEDWVSQSASASEEVYQTHQTWSGQEVQVKLQWASMCLEGEDYYLVCLRDVTEDQQLQEQLLQSQEMLIQSAAELQDEVLRRMAAQEELSRALKELERKNAILEQLAVRDPLTSVYNRGYLEKRLESEAYRASRYKEPMGLLLLDLDHFKLVNDTYGHQVGDEVLIKVTEILQNRLRRSDILARYGGEEFVVLAPNTDFKGTMALAELLKDIVKKEKFRAEDTSFHVTVSIGVAVFDPESSARECPEDLIRRADQALYQAKRSGRNRVEIA